VPSSVSQARKHSSSGFVFRESHAEGRLTKAQGQEHRRTTVSGALAGDELLYGSVEVAFTLVESPMPDSLDEPQRRVGDALCRGALEGPGEEPVLRAAKEEGAGFYRSQPVGRIVTLGCSDLRFVPTVGLSASAQRVWQSPSTSTTSQA
jgi:hypothetical protein